MDKADELGMVAIVGLFYFGQDQHVRDEAGVRRAVTNSANWLLERNYRNAMIEVANETNSSAFDHDVLKPPRIHELIQLVKSATVKGNRLLAGTSYGGGRIPESSVVGASTEFWSTLVIRTFQAPASALDCSIAPTSRRKSWT